MIYKKDNGLYSSCSIYIDYTIIYKNSVEHARARRSAAQHILLQHMSWLKSYTFME